MLCTILLLAQGSAISALDYSGVPTLSSPNPYRIVTHGATLEIEAADDRGASGLVKVQSTTVYRNMGGDGKATLVIPRAEAGDADPKFAVTATWDNQPIKATALKSTLAKLEAKEGETAGGTGVEHYTGLTASVPLKSQGTHALRISYTTSLQKTGYAGDHLVTAYSLDAHHDVELLSVAFKTGPMVVFGLPELSPDLSWEIGAKGASTRQTNFAPKSEPAKFTFRPNSFRSGGS